MSLHCNTRENRRTARPLFLLLLLTCIAIQGFSQLSGVQTIPGNYPTFVSAVAALNAQGVAIGGVEFHIAAGYVEQNVQNVVINPTINRPSKLRPVTFKKQGAGSDPLFVSGTGTNQWTDVMIKLLGIEYVTFDGISLQENPSNNSNSNWVETGFLMDASWGIGCKYNTIKNCSVQLHQANSQSVGIKMQINYGTIYSDLETVGHSFNQFLSNSIENVARGYVLQSGAGTALQAACVGNRIDQDPNSGRPSMISNFSAVQLYACGIEIDGFDQTVIAHTKIDSRGISPTNRDLFGIKIVGNQGYSTEIYNDTITLDGGPIGGAIVHEANGGSNGSFVNVHDNLITSCRDYGGPSLMAFSGVISKLQIADNKVINNGDSLNANGRIIGINVSGAVDELVVQGNLIERNYFDDDFAGINVIARFGLAEITDNFIHDNHAPVSGSGAFAGIILSDNTTIYEQPKVRLTGNRIVNNSGCTNMYGINLMNGTPTLLADVLIDSNEVSNISGGSVTGIFLGQVSAVEASRNVIRDLTAGNTIIGISAVGGGGFSINENYTIHDNYISEFHLGYDTTFSSVHWGISVEGGTLMTTKIFQNTVYLNSPSGGSVIKSAALRYWGTVTDHYLSGNILVNLTDPGFSTGFSNAIYVVSATLQLNPLSGGNCLYAGTPSTLNRLLSVFNGPSYTTIATYRAAMSPAEQNSFTEIPPFLNVAMAPYDLHLSSTIPTRCEQGSPNHSLVANDLDGDIRQGYPGFVPPTSGGLACDVGADEFTGIPFNGTPPRIQYLPLTTGLVGTSRVLTQWATIDDPEGVDVSPGNLPRLYYKRSTDPDTLVDNTSLSQGWKYVEATVTGNNFSFTMDYTRLFGGSVNTGTSISYFVVAQDIGSPQMVGTNFATLASAPTSVQLVASNFPASGPIRSFTLSSTSLSGTILVGTGQTHTSLTNPGGAFELINAAVLTGDVEIKVTSDLLNESGVVDLNPWPEEDMRGIYSVRISPDTSIMRRIEGRDATSALLRLNHVDRVRIDGMVGGQRGYLLIRNKAWGLPAIRLENGAQDIQISGCIVESLESSLGIAIGQNESPSSLTERGCDRVHIDHNEFRMRTDTIVSNGGAMPAIEVRQYANEGYAHDSITIAHNYFSSLGHPGYGFDPAAIRVFAHCDGMRIDSNHFYFPQPTISANADRYQFIYVSAPMGSRHGNLHIGGNYFGGSQPFCQGAAIPRMNLVCRYFQGIGVSYPGSDVVIEDNHFQNVKLNFTGFGNTFIYNLPNFAFIQGRWGHFSIVNNQIGASGAAGKLQIKWNSIQTSKQVHGIILGDSTSCGASGVIANNYVMNVEAYDSSLGSPPISGGWISAYSRWHEGEMAIRNNHIGDTLGTDAVSFSGRKPNIFGIHVGSRTSRIQVEDNLIGNLHIGNLVPIDPFFISAGLASGGCGSVEITGNYIENSGQSNPFPTPGTSRHGYPSSIRVLSRGRDNLVAGNRIRLSPRDSQGRQQGTRVVGILIQAPLTASGKVFGNTIDGGGLKFGQANTTFTGIKLKTANDWTVHSNSIIVGDSGTLHPTIVTGILDSAMTGENRVINNTVAMAGTLASSNATAAYAKMGGASTILRNNLLINAIPVGAATPDYAISIALNDPATVWNAQSSNYNLLVSGDSTRVAKMSNTGGPVSFATWKASGMGDRESYAATTATLPLSTLFVNYPRNNLHINPNSSNCWYVNGKGIAGDESGLEAQDIDFDSARSTTLGIPVDIGADEFAPAVGVMPLSCQASGPAVAGTTTSYSFAGRPIGEITWPSGASVPQAVDWKYYSSVPPIGSGGQDINSYWKVAFGGVTGLNCDIRYYYSIHEQAGLPDQSLNLGQRLANGPWFYQQGAIGVNVGGKYFDKTGLNTVDEFTLGIQAPSTPFVITTTVVSGQGSAMPSNSVSVLPLADQTISFVGNGCYWVDSVFVDGNYVGNPASYSFTAVQSNHQIVVKFRHALLPPVVSITQASGSYCPGSPIGLTATTFLGGSAPTYQWYVNNLPIGTNNPNLTGTFQSGDVLNCVMTSNDSCAVWPMDTSNLYIVAQVDSVAPTATCNAFTLQLSPFGSATLLPQNVAAASYDFCGIASTTLSQSSFTCSDVGTQNVLVTVQDSSGNSASCTAVVTVAASPIATTLVPVTNVCGRQISCYGGQDGSVTAQPTGGCPPYTYAWSNGANTATIANLAAGTFTVTVTDVTGGTSTSSVQMQQPFQPNITVSQADSSCAGDSTGAIVVLTTVSNNCQPHATLWTFPNGNQSSQQNLSGIPPGNYYLLVTDVLGCQDSTTVTIGSLPSPQPFITQSGNVLSTTTSFASYQWLFFGAPIPGATSSSYTSIVPGEYQVQVTSPSGCIGTSTIYLLVGSPDPTTTLPGLVLYPNPTYERVLLFALEGIRGKVQLQMRNQVGQLVRTFELNDLMSPQTLNLTGLSAGSYFLHVQDDKMRVVVLKLDIQ